MCLENPGISHGGEFYVITTEEWRKKAHLETFFFFFFFLYSRWKWFA